MKDVISQNSLKRPKKSTSEKQIAELQKITKYLGGQNEMIRKFLNLYTRNELCVFKHEPKKGISDVIQRPNFQMKGSPYLTSTLCINSNKIGILEKTQEVKPLKKKVSASKPNNLIYNSRARLSTSYMEVKLARPQKPFDIWKVHNHIHVDLKVFVIIGKYADLRAALVRRGWVENKSPDSIFFDLKWARSARLPSSLADWQLYNHFPRNIQLTAKWNLCKNLNKQLIKAENKSSLTYFPRCFKLNNSGFQKFSNYFKVVQAISILKETEQEPYKHHFEKLASSIQIGKRWISMMKEEEVDSEFEIVMNHDWRILSTSDYRTIGSYYARMLKGENLHELCSAVLQEVKRLDPQFSMSGTKNIWIVKPGHKSRGRDISIHSNIRDVYNYTDSSDLCIVQKYIENPLLINSKKFDIRQWVLITNNDPLVVWSFKECYLRFTINDYSIDELNNLFAHLTNNSISKKSMDFMQSEIQGCMWTLDTFKQYLQAEYGFNVWEEKIYPDIKHIIKRSLLAVGNLGRKNSFELLGYDFMIDSNLSTWLLEINSSPAMDYSTVIYI